MPLQPQVSRTSKSELDVREHCGRLRRAGSDRTSGYAFAAADALCRHDVPKFVKAHKSFFSNIPYDMTDRRNEQMWQTIVTSSRAR